MPYDFDIPINRIGTHSVKWDGLKDRFGVEPEGALPMWVADMEFAAPPCVNTALQRMIDNGVHGYYGAPASYLASIQNWMKTRHNWEIETDWIISTGGVVNGVYLAIQTFTEPGDGIIIQQPIYHPFAPGIRNNGRHVVGNLMTYENGRYSMDLEALAEAVDEKTRMMLLCSPHNPCGRVWEAGELRALAEFCMERDILIVSDEIHHDLVFDGPHTVMATLGADIADNLVTFTSASKTFNLAGGHVGQCIISNPELRRRMKRQIERCGMLVHNRFGMEMTEAAYSEGAEWLDELLVYLKGNRDYLDERVAALPGISSVKLDATYLSWLDCSGTGMNADEVIDRFWRRAKVICNTGPSFGPGGAGFMRLNFACPRSMLVEGMDRLEEAFSDLQ
ncbi:MAG: MalY/PatB family protein [Pseudomonadota bacterium]